MWCSNALILIGAYVETGAGKMERGSGYESTSVPCNGGKGVFSVDGGGMMRYAFGERTMLYCCRVRFALVLHMALYASLG